MKTFSFILLGQLLPFVAFSQFSNGTITVGGDLSYRRTTTNVDNPSASRIVNRYSVRPQFAIFVVTNLQVGVSFTYATANSKSGPDNTSDASSKSTEISGGVVVRYYYKYFFLEGRYERGQNKFESVDSGFDFSSKTEFNTKVIGFGRSFMIGTQVAIEPKISFESKLFESTGNTKSNDLLFSVGVNTFIDRKKNSKERSSQQ